VHGSEFGGIAPAGGILYTPIGYDADRANPLIRLSPLQASSTNAPQLVPRVPRAVATRTLRRRLWTLSLIVLVVALSWRPVYRDQVVLQHLPTALGLVALWAVSRRPGLSNTSFACVLAFLALHVVGARWVYSQVPYDAWIETLTGRTLSETFGWERNHYDRFVHLAFGALFVGPIHDVLKRTVVARGAWAWGCAITGVVAASAGYELVEWGLAVTIAPDSAERYLGQQGDPWDAQKDMALATLGAIAAGCVASAIRLRTLQSSSATAA